jgi:MFS-type transporter involved in bile tolerance (Atg22 family)
MGASELLYNAIFMISSLIIILLGRYIGTKIDTSGYQSRIKISLTISAFALFVLFGINILSLSSEVQIRLAFLLIIISNFGYHIGRICHNSYLRGHIPEEVQSKMSGL